MHGQQCNTCGAFDDSSTRSVSPCQHCPTLVCDHCRKNHEPYCEKNQKLIRAGGGATIANVPQAPHRHGHEIPEDVRTPAPEPAWADKVGEITNDGTHVWVNAGPAAPDEPVNQGLWSVADLLKIADNKTNE